MKRLSKEQIDSYVEKIKNTGDGSHRQQVLLMIGDAQHQFSASLASTPQKYLDKNGDAHPFPCKEGCSSCCYLPVQVLEPEVTIITVWLYQKYGPDAVRYFGKKAKESWEKIRHTKDDSRLEISVPCPFLENGSCFIYEHRPLACRAYLSCDVTACDRHKNDPKGKHVSPMAKQPIEAYLNLAGQIIQIAEKINASCRIYDLIEASNISLNDLNYQYRVDAGLSGFTGPSEIFSRSIF